MAFFREIVTIGLYFDKSKYLALHLLCLNLLPSLDLLIRSFHLRQRLDTIQPRLHLWIIIQTQTSILILSHPRLKVKVNDIRPIPGQDPVSTVFLQLLLQNSKASIGLGLISLICILILDVVIMTKPITLTYWVLVSTCCLDIPRREIVVRVLGKLAYLRMAREC